MDLTKGQYYDYATYQYDWDSHDNAKDYEIIK